MKNNPPHTDPSQHMQHEVEADDFERLDWHRITFPLGVQTELGGPERALRLTEEELEVLEKLLTKDVTGTGGSAATDYVGLRGLAAFAKGTRGWLKRRGLRLVR